MKKKAIALVVVMVVTAIALVLAISLIRQNTTAPSATEAPATDVVTAEPETPTPEIITPEPETPTPEVITPEPATPTPEIITPEPETPTPEVITPEPTTPTPEPITPTPEIVTPMPEIILPDIGSITLDPTSTPLPSSRVCKGDTILFGKYEQDGNAENGPEPIEWIVLDVKDGKALIISKYSLDVKPYNDDLGDVTWETCSLRTWLNTSFVRTAFSSEEQGSILITTVNNSVGQGYSEWSSTSGGNNTLDQIFLLSYAEAYAYFDVTYANSQNMNARTAPTAYAVSKGAVPPKGDFTTTDGKKAAAWWLRSPGPTQDRAAVVNTSGSLGKTVVYSLVHCVRPALWIDLKSDSLK